MKKSLWTLTAVAMVTLTGCGTASSQTSTSALDNSSAVTNASSTASSANLKTQSVALTVLPGGRLGPDGRMHDSFTNPDFTVVEGVPVKLTVYNYDGGAHTITNSMLSLNLSAKGSQKKGVPAVTSVTFTPNKTGDFTWQCVDVCDGENKGWAMSHVDYMEGIIHVVPFSNKQYIYLAIKDGLQYAAADGNLHDAYSPADITVQKGIPAVVTVENFDTGQHSFTVPGLNLNQLMKGAEKAGVPATTTFTFTPNQAGIFHWMCAVPCDGNGWAMANDGYMAGNITVSP